MMQKPRRTPKLFTSINSAVLTSILVVICGILLFAESMTSSPSDGRGPDLPRVQHPVSMPNSLREDAILISVTRDGLIYLGVEQVSPDSLEEKILERLKDHRVERKAYINADVNARYGQVKEVLDGVRSAGISRVGFLAKDRWQVSGH